MELAHYVTPVRRQEWSEVADQRLYVWARFVDDRTRTIAGAEFLHPYVSLDTNHKVIDHQELEHPEIWFADQTDTDEDLRGHGIASALYAHLRAFHYAITPSPALMAGGCALWQRLHPTYDADEEAGLLQTRSVVFTEAKLSEIITRFAPIPMAKFSTFAHRLIETISDLSPGLQGRQMSKNSGHPGFEWIVFRNRPWQLSRWNV